ncbi:MAG: hypothetical protein ACI3YB_02660, partial [Prevotella sp.]
GIFVVNVKRNTYLVLLALFACMMFSCNNKSVREDDGIYRTFVRDSVFSAAVAVPHPYLPD